MEVYNAIILFQRSKLFGFRYTTYVADGENKVYPALQKMKIYDPIKIERYECSNHLQNKMSKSSH